MASQTPLRRVPTKTRGARTGSGGRIFFVPPVPARPPRRSCVPACGGVELEPLDVERAAGSPGVSSAAEPVAPRRVEHGCPQLLFSLAHQAAALWLFLAPCHVQAAPVSASPAPADLNLLGQIAPSPVDKALSNDEQKRAAAMAHHSAALQAETAGDMRAALRHYQAMLRAAPVVDADLTRRTMELAMRHGQPGEAEEMLQAVIQAQPNEAAPVLRLVEFLDAYHADAESRQRADDLLRDALARFPDDLETLTTAVLRHLVQGRREEARNLLRAAAAREGGDAARWLALAGVAQEVWPLGQSEVADEHKTEVNVFYEKALQRARADGDRDREMEVAQYYLLSNQLGAARTVCERMAARDGDLAARKVLFRLYEAQDLKEKAFAMLEGIVRDDPKDVAQRRLLVDVLIQRKQYAEAARHLEAVIQVASGAAEDYDRLANLWLLGLRQPDKALTLLARALRLYPDTPSFHAQQARAYSDKRDYSKAVEAYAEADRLVTSGGSYTFNQPFQFYFQYGSALERAGRYDEAARQLRRSIDAVPEAESEFLANTLNYLGYMWADLGRHLDEAEKLIGKALELSPENPMFIDSLGWLRHKQGRQKEALKELLRAEKLLKELEPEDAEILEHIAVVQEALGQKDKALEAYKRAAALQTTDEKVARRILDGVKRLEGGKGKAAPGKGKNDK